MVSGSLTSLRSLSVLASLLSWNPPFPSGFLFFLLHTLILCLFSDASPLFWYHLLTMGICWDLIPPLSLVIIVVFTLRSMVPNAVLCSAWLESKFPPLALDTSRSPPSWPTSVSAAWITLYLTSFHLSPLPLPGFPFLSAAMPSLNQSPRSKDSSYSILCISYSGHMFKSFWKQLWTQIFYFVVWPCVDPFILILDWEDKKQ